MGAFLARRWFLLSLAVGVGLAALRPEWLRPATAPIPPRLVIALALFLMAWGLPTRRLVGSLRRPLPVLWAVLLSYGLLPALAWLAGPLLPEDDYRIGLFVMASAPCTLASAVLWARMAGGDEATALLVTLVTVATGWLFTTTWLTAGTDVVVAIDAPGMMVELLLVLVLPVSVGQLARRSDALAELAERGRRPLGVVSQTLVLVIILKAAVDVCQRLAGETRALAVAPLAGTALLCVAIHLAGLAVGWGSSCLLGFDRAVAVAVAFACSQKTLPVALVLFETYFKEAHPLAVVPMVLYHAGQLIADTLVADRMKSKAPLLPPP